MPSERAKIVNKAADFFVDRELNRMVRRINGDIGRPADWTRRPVDVLRQGRRDRIDKDTGISSGAGRRLNRSSSEPSVVEVSRVWDLSRNKPRGRFDAYHQFDPIQLGMYVDVYV